MASDTVTMRLEGDVPLTEFSVAVSQFNLLIVGLSRVISPKVPIDWAVEELISLPTAAETTVYGRSEQRGAVHSVARGYLEVGQALRAGEMVPYGVGEPATKMRGVLNGRINTLVFETADSEAAVQATPPKEPESRREVVTMGAVMGRIQTVTNRGPLRFTLYDTLHDRAISCYLQPGHEEVMLGVWGKVAVVEGLVRRDPKTGRPLSVREIRNVVVRPEGERGSFREAIGALEGPFRMTAAEAVRQLRDA